MKGVYEPNMRGKMVFLLNFNDFPLVFGGLQVSLVHWAKKEVFLGTTKLPNLELNIGKSVKLV